MKKKSNSDTIENFYSPYENNKNDTMTEFYARYINDNDKYIFNAKEC